MSPPGTTVLPTSGDEILRIARRHIGEKYVLGVLVAKDNPNWVGPWDCAEFVSWVVFQAAGRLYGCENNIGDPATADAYTGYWKRDAETLGQIIPIGKAACTPGAAVLRVPQAGAIGHIVISDGNGGTVEAHSSGRGVIQSTLSYRRWDLGILIPGFSYAHGSEGAVEGLGTTVYRVTAPVMTGSKILEIQKALKSSGFDPGPLDGEFGPHTLSASVAFQLSRGLVPDGEVGPQTATALGIEL